MCRLSGSKDGECLTVSVIFLSPDDAPNLTFLPSRTTGPGGAKRLAFDMMSSTFQGFELLNELPQGVPVLKVAIHVVG